MTALGIPHPPDPDRLWETLCRSLVHAEAAGRVASRTGMCAQVTEHRARKALRHPPIASTA